MALTVSYDSPRAERISRSFGQISGVATFDSSYAYGGEALALNNKFKSVKQVCFEPVAGYSFEYDFTNNKVQAFRAAPPIVFEEVVDADADTATLRYPAAFIISVTSANTAHKVVDGSLTPAAGQVAVDLGSTAGVLTRGQRATLTFPSGEGAAATYVTYITQAWKDVLENLVFAKLTAGARVYGHADLTFTAGTPDVITLGELAVAIQNVTWDDNGTVKDVDALYKGETAATKEVTIDFSDSSDVSLSVLQTDTWDASTDSVYITYIKKPAAGFLANRFVEEDDLTPSSDVATTTYPMLLFGTCGGLPGATTKFTDLLRFGATVGTTATNLKTTNSRYMSGSSNTFTFGSDHGDADHIKPSYIYGDPSEIEVQPLEVPSAEDLSTLAVRFYATGLL